MLVWEHFRVVKNSLFVLSIGAERKGALSNRPFHSKQDTNDTIEFFPVHFEKIHSKVSCHQQRGKIAAKCLSFWKLSCLPTALLLLTWNSNSTCWHCTIILRAAILSETGLKIGKLHQEKMTARTMFKSVGLQTICSLSSVFGIRKNF